MPNLLYIDTSNSLATVAFSADGRTKAILTHHNASEQAAVLNTMIHDVLERAGTSLDTMDALCICAGPGSYTGLRVGLSVAKGIAYATNTPLMLFNRLDLLAWEQHKEVPFAVLLKARASEYFLAIYKSSGEQDTLPRHIFEKDLQPFTEQGLLFITDDPYFSLSDNKEYLDIAHPVNMDSWIKHAEQRFRSGLFDDLAYSEPFYLKAAFTTQSKK